MRFSDGTPPSRSLSTDKVCELLVPQICGIVADELAEQGKSKPVKVYKGGDKSEGAKLWSLKVEKDGLCTGCGGKRSVGRSE